MASVLDKVCTCLFGLFIFSAILADYLCCVFLKTLRSAKILSPTVSEGMALMATKFTWACGVRSALWIRTLGCSATTPGAWDDFLADLRAADAQAAAGGLRQPVFIMSNHVSFLDTLMIVVHTPPQVLWRIRCYMGAHLFSLPLFATICKVLGHFPVYFLKNEDGKFSVDAARMAGVEARVEEHLAAGGILSLFPEGALNKKDPDTLQTFRYGTFKRALKSDAKVWHLVMFAHEQVWRGDEAIGGRPALTGMALYPMFRSGAKAELAALRKAAAAAGGGKKNPPPPLVSCETGSGEDYVILAEHAKRAMQAQYDDLKAQVDARTGKGRGGERKKTA